MSVSMHIEYQSSLHCIATHGPSQNRIITDAPIDNGGKGEAFSPTDLLGCALGSCALTVMGIAANTNKIPIDGMTCELVKEMVATPRRRIGSLDLKIAVRSPRELTLEEQKKLELAAQQCPVKESLGSDVKVQMAFSFS